MISTGEEVGRVECRPASEKNSNNDGMTYMRDGKYVADDICVADDVMWAQRDCGRGVPGGGGPNACPNEREEFTFQNEPLRRFLGSSDYEPQGLPHWAFALARELKNLTHRRIFDVTLDRREKIPTYQRSVQEIQTLVEWSRRLAPSCCDQADNLQEMLLCSEGESVELMLFIYEHWFMDEENWGFYIIGEDYPERNIDTKLQASIGNVAAAAGLAVLDRLLESVASPHTDELTRLSLAWDLARIAGYHDRGLVWDFFDFFDRKPCDRPVPADLWEQQANAVGKPLAVAPDELPDWSFE